jgi:hypothetical protein
MLFTNYQENEEMKNQKIIVSASAIAILVFSLMAIIPTNAAADTIVNPDTWFVNTLQTIPYNSSSYSNAGTILHEVANYTWAVMRSPQVAGTVQIGTAKSQMILDFNNVTNLGNMTLLFSMNLTETNSTKNPYGVGSIDVTATAVVTSMGTSKLGLPTVPANGTGTLVSTAGTGAFATAKLYGDFVINPLAVGSLSPNGYTEALFFGTHSRVNGNGVLVYYPALSASAFCSVTVMRGQTWNFVAQSTGGVGPNTYQWFEGSTLLTGQNSMILSMNKATQGTYTYTCRVIDSYGNTVITNAVTLTVL